MLDYLRRLIGPEAILIAVFILMSSGLYLGASHFGSVIESNGTVVQVAGRARLEMTALYRWFAEAESGDPAQRENAIEQISQTSAQINALLNSMAEGGAIEIAPGMSLTVQTDLMPSSAAPIVPQIIQIWRPIHNQIEAMTELGGADRDRVLGALINDARQSEQALIGQSSRLIGTISVDSFNNAERLQQVQITGAALGVAFILFLIWLYSRQLRKFRAAKRGTDEILQTVDSGLFLLDRDYRLGEQYSAELEYILQRGELDGTDFMKMLADMVPKDTLDTVRDYLDLLFSERVEESLIGSLNPLDRVRVKLPTSTGRIEERFLAFSFRRVFDGDELLHLLVSVSDVTDRVRLTEEIDSLKEQQDQHTERMLELLVSLFKLDPDMLEETLLRWHRLMQKANDALKESNSRKGDLRPLINEVFRPMHTLKSEAAGLKLEFLAQRAAAVEDAIAELRKAENLTGNDFLPATVRLEELFAQFSVVRSIIERLHQQGVTRTASGEAITDTGQRLPLATLVQRLVRQLNEELGIDAALRMQGLDDDLLPDNMREPLRDILVQLIRNACAHGIERPAERRTLDKPEQATLDLRLTQDRKSKDWNLVFRDDGRGIDFEAIRQRAIEMELINPDSGKLARDQALRLMFHPGLSTARKVRDDAGQGVGMDIVREAVANLDANIRVGTREGAYTLFKISIPATS